MTARTVLLRVLDLFEEHDWCQEEYCDSMEGAIGNEEFSLDGAILHVVEFHDGDRAFAEAVAGQVLKAIGFRSVMNEDNLTTLARWNDSDERTKEQVLEAVRDTLALILI
jgi:hypothetical protein